MARRFENLLNYLGQDNPTLRVEERQGRILSAHVSATDEKEKQKKPTKSLTRRLDKWPDLQILDEWTEFTAQTINGIFDGKLSDVLNRNLEETLQDHYRLDEAFLGVCSENTLESVLIKTTQSVVVDALCGPSRSLLERKVAMARGDLAYLPYARTLHDRPDWAGIESGEWQDPNTKAKPPNILPGDTKVNWVCDIDEMIRKFDPKEPIHSSLDALLQVSYYCIHSLSRYGYVLTDKELLVIRLRPHPPCPRVQDPHEDIEAFLVWVRAHLAVEYARIPWKRQDSKGALTINMALWVLHLLAANDGAIQNQPYMPLAEEKLRPKVSGRVLPRPIPRSESQQALKFDTKNKEFRSFQSSKTDTDSTQPSISSIDRDSILSAEASEMPVSGRTRNASSTANILTQSITSSQGSQKRKSSPRQSKVSKRGRTNGQRQSRDRSG